MLIRITVWQNDPFYCRWSWSYAAMQTQNFLASELCWTCYNVDAYDYINQHNSFKASRSKQALLWHGKKRWWTFWTLWTVEKTMLQIRSFFNDSILCRTVKPIIHSVFGYENRVAHVWLPAAAVGSQSLLVLQTIYASENFVGTEFKPYTRRFNLNYEVLV